MSKIDPNEVNEVFERLEKYYATLTPEQLEEHLRRAMPQGEELEEANAWLECITTFPPEESESPADKNS